MINFVKILLVKMKSLSGAEYCFLLNGVWIILLCAAPHSAQNESFVSSDAAEQRWRGKKIIDSRLLDDMEASGKWTLNGSQTYKPKNPGATAYSRERAKDGVRSLRLTGTVRGSEAGERDFGSVSVVREFDSEDWRKFNRVSFWVYPQFSGVETVTMVVALYNNGEEKLSSTSPRRERLNYVQLKNNSWNQVSWEIPQLPREKVTGLEFLYRMQGKSTNKGSDKFIFDFDRLELQRVEADYYEGWQVAPDRIAYSHSGYLPNSRKTALSSNLNTQTFSLINQKTKKIVLTRPIENVHNHTGAFQVMDFTEVGQTGDYYLQAGNVRTRPFRIARDIWDSSIWKTLNFYRAERCGIDVPGVHTTCHFDVRSVDSGKSLVVNGGWHDAGDVSLGLVKNAESVYALLTLAERLRTKPDGDSKLVEALENEAKWGLKWILKTSFHNGKRAFWTTMARWTNNIAGDADDVVSKASDNPFANFHAAAAEALAARVLEKSDPDIARHSLQMAKEDWQFAVDGASAAADAKEGEDENPANSPLEIASVGVMASLELYRATGEASYSAKALEFADTIVNSQQRVETDWETPLSGFFYNSPAKTKLVHYDHLGRDQAPIVALTELCKTLPENEKWMKWYSGAALHSEYLKKIAQFTAPYNFLPNGIYRDDEYLQMPLRRRESFQKQIASGIKIGSGYSLRIFPVWFDFRGVYGPLLGKTKALSAAAELRGDRDSFMLAEQQAQWIVGRNPFAQSTMYGEGYDFAPVFSPMSGNLVGGLPGGVMTREDSDVPYFPNSAMTNYKEIGTHRSARWLWLISDLYSPNANPKISESSDSKLKFTVAAEMNADTTVTITISASGLGKHRLDLRADNLQIEKAAHEIVLNDQKIHTFSWKARIENRQAKWFLVVVPDRDISAKKEVAGMNQKK